MAPTQTASGPSPQASTADLADPTDSQTVTAGPERLAVSQLKELVIDSLEDDKAEEILAIDLRGKTSMADHMIIANGRSQRQVGAIADHLIDRVKKSDGRTPKIEGMPQADWVLLDLGDIIVHLFRPEVRAFYNLEKMWSVAFDGAAADDAEPAGGHDPAGEDDPELSAEAIDADPSPQ